MLPVYRVLATLTNELLPALKGGSDDGDGGDEISAADMAAAEARAREEAGEVPLAGPPPASLAGGAERPDESDAEDSAATVAAAAAGGGGGNGSGGNHGGVGVKTPAARGGEPMPKRGMKQRGRPQTKEEIEAQRE